MPLRHHCPGVLRRAATAAAAGALAFAGALALPATPARADATTSGDVIADLWSYNWDSVAAECTDVLGPNGYGAVWVAPPAESLKQTNYYWWDVYQPYSYDLNGRFGTAAQFASMVKACHTAGVKVYTDAVINHTAAQTGTGYNGTTITNKYDTPDWDPDDYHTSAECNDSDLIIDDWSNLSEIQNCELLGLPDLEQRFVGSYVHLRDRNGRRDVRERRRQRRDFGDGVRRQREPDDPAKSAIAFYDGAFTPCDTCEDPDDGTSTVTATFNAYAPTTTGQDVYVVGSIAALGGWDTSKAVKLSSSGYPVWSGTASVPVYTSFEYRYLKKDSSGNVTWESGTNRSYTTGTSSGYASTDSWK